MPAFQPMDRAEMGEIALKLFMREMRQKGIRFPQDEKRNVNQTAQDIGVKPEKAKHFIETIHRQMFAEMYPDAK